MTQDPTSGLLAELLAERFGPRATPPPALMGSTVEMLRRIDLCAGDDLADIIEFPARRPAENVTSSHPDPSTRRLAASQ